MSLFGILAVAGLAVTLLAHAATYSTWTPPAWLTWPSFVTLFVSWFAMVRRGARLP